MDVYEVVEGNVYFLFIVIDMQYFKFSNIYIICGI